MPLLPIVPRLLTAFHNLAGNLQSPLLLLIRLYWGWEFFLTGKGKLMNLDRTAEFFDSIGIPFPQANALLAASTECFGGLLLMVGLISRLTALPLTLTMLVAYATTEQEALSQLFREGNAEPFLQADPFQFMLAAVLILAFGPGRLAIDSLLSRCCTCSPEQLRSSTP